MPVTGTNSENKDSRFVVEELVVGGQEFAPAAQAGAISDVVVTGTYADDDDAIEAAINGILAVLRSNGMIAS